MGFHLQWPYSYRWVFTLLIAHEPKLTWIGIFKELTKKMKFEKDVLNLLTHSTRLAKSQLAIRVEDEFSTSIKHSTTRELAHFIDEMKFGLTWRKCIRKSSLIEYLMTSCTTYYYACSTYNLWDYVQALWFSGVWWIYLVHVAFMSMFKTRYLDSPSLEIAQALNQRIPCLWMNQFSIFVIH